MIWLWSLAADEWIFAIGGLIFILMGSLLVKGLGQPKPGVLGFVTTIFTSVPHALIQLTQKLVITFAPATFGPQQRVAAGLHDIARLNDDTAAVIDAQSAILVQLAEAAGGALSAADLAAARARLDKRIGNAEQQARGIGADVQPKINAAVRGIDAVLSPRLTTLDREIARVNRDVIPQINSRVNEADREITNLWKWTRQHTLLAGTRPFYHAVAAALTWLGLDWIKCKTARDLFRRRGCSFWNDLEAVAIGATAIAAGLSLVDLAKAEQEIVGDLASVVKDFWQV